MHNPVTRVIYPCPPYWTWIIGHDSLNVVSNPIVNSKYQMFNILQGNVISDRLIQYDTVPNNLSLADGIMMGIPIEDHLSKFCENLPSNSMSSDNNIPLDYSALKRVSIFLHSLDDDTIANMEDAYGTVLEFIAELERCIPGDFQPSDDVVGLGRIVPSSSDVSILCPPDGMTSNYALHQSRILGELIIFGTLYYLGNKYSNLTSCRAAYDIVSNNGWTVNKNLNGAIVTILDHARRRTLGLQCPPKTVESIIVIASSFLRSGLSGFERMLYEHKI